MATIVEDGPAVQTFPREKVVAALTDELVSLVRSESQTRGIAIPAEPGAVRTAAVPIDSLSVVDILCAIEPIIKVELRESIVQTGGYSSIEDALGHLIPRIERAWARKKEPKK